MRAVSLEESERLRQDIREQAATCNALADLFAPPWGALGRERMTRLYCSRMRACAPTPSEVING
ncbi:MAG: hypothetical protein WA418_38680 [Bradyrhizobium sp.]